LLPRLKRELSDLNSSAFKIPRSFVWNLENLNWIVAPHCCAVAISTAKSSKHPPSSPWIWLFTLLDFSVLRWSLLESLDPELTTYGYCLLCLFECFNKWGDNRWLQYQFSLVCDCLQKPTTLISPHLSIISHLSRTEVKCKISLCLEIEAVFAAQTEERVK
jgi:hypothetical protein